MSDSRPADFESVAHVFVPDVSTERGVVTGDDARHLLRSLRVRTGETITVADGHGPWRVGRISSLGSDHLEWEATSVARSAPAPRPSIAVAFALGKGDKPERVVRQLTELGVERISPLITERCVLRWDADKRAAALRRFERIVREAAMQSRRETLPRVDPVGSSPGPTPTDLLVGHPTGRPVLDVLTGLADDAPWTVLVGPEGGFSARELGDLGPHELVRVSRTVLRTETAPVALAAVLLAERERRIGPRSGDFHAL